MHDLDSFPLDSHVLLKACPHGQPGRVTGISRGKIVVRWEDLQIVGKFQSESLIPVAAERLNG